MRFQQFTSKSFHSGNYIATATAASTAMAIENASITTSKSPGPLCTAFCRSLSHFDRPIVFPHRRHEKTFRLIPYGRTTPPAKHRGHSLISCFGFIIKFQVFSFQCSVKRGEWRLEHFTKECVKSLGGVPCEAERKDAVRGAIRRSGTQRATELDAKTPFGRVLAKRDKRAVWYLDGITFGRFIWCRFKQFSVS